MISKKKPKLCMFCGGDKSIGPMSREHFVPKCLWSGSRPIGTKTLPAHVACNAKYADDNDYFRTIIVADDGLETHPEASRIRDQQINRIILERRGQWERYTKDAAIRPRFTKSGVYLGHQRGFPINMAIMHRVLGNIVKGIFYTITDRPLRLDTRIIAEICESENDREYKPLTSIMGDWMGFGDDVFTYRAAFCEDIESMACLLSFYRRKFYFVRTEAAAKPPPPIDFESAVLL